MGILGHKTTAEDQPKFIPYEKKYATGKFFAMTRPPFLIAKLVEFKTAKESIEDFKAKQIDYLYKQMPDFNVIFIQAGFSEVPTKIIKDCEIETALEQLCLWYYQTHLKNNKALSNRLKIKR